MSVALTGEVMESPSLVRADECRWVSETATGLRFREDTPIEVWGELVERLQRQHKRIEWALGDALRFGESTYGDMYTQWAEETGLSENTLATIKWVAGAVDPSRRREDVGWSHHREVAPLDPPEQERLLELAADKGMTRWQLRQEVKRREESQRGLSTPTHGEAAEPDDAPGLPLSVADLTDEARAALDQKLLGVGKRHRQGFESGWVACLVWLHQEDAFREWRI